MTYSFILFEYKTKKTRVVYVLRVLKIELLEIIEPRVVITLFYEVYNVQYQLSTKFTQFNVKIMERQ